ncbi:MAG: hypothetical protein R6V00_08890 [Candidatus Aminicenantes bacterium]
MRIYITHCSAKKNDDFKNSNMEVFPDELYASKRIRAFMNRCKEKMVEWAIFSDLYGIWFSEEKHSWYDKSPDSVTEEEYNSLLLNFDQRLLHYNEIWFYHNPGRFHPLYKQIIKDSALKNKIHLFTHKEEIV